MCNCNSGISLCDRCSKGLTCGCPPDYTVLPLPVACGCCPPGYTWSGATPNWPDGVCTGAGGRQVSPIDCTPCVDSVPAKCVILPAISCFGVPKGTTLYDFINTYMCSEAFVLKILNEIGLSTTLKTVLCQLTTSCPPASSKTPIITSIVTTVP